MSMDGVDDLHAAEDALFETRSELHSLVRAVEAYDSARGVAKVPLRRTVVEMLRRANAMVEEPYCRPTCGDECDNDDCGCPHHDGGTRPYEGA